MRGGGEEVRTSILSLWQIPDSQRRSNISISSAKETRARRRGDNEKQTEHG